MIKAVNNTKTWIRRNWISIILSFLLLGVIIFHFYGTYNPPITQAIIVSPITKNKELSNGQMANIKVSTLRTDNPYQSGFSEGFVKDTIGKILGVKEKEILAINQIKGNYKDSLKLVKEELDAQKKLTKLYQSKDSKGNIVGTAKVTDGGPLVYQGNINLTSTIKKGNKKTPDSILFYDPTNRFTINESKEFTYNVPLKTKKQKLTFSAQIGAGIIVPQFKPEKSTFGGYGGVGISYNF